MGLGPNPNPNPDPDPDPNPTPHQVHAWRGGGRWFTQRWNVSHLVRANATLIFDRRTGGQGGEGMTSAGQWCVDISPHLPTCRHISPHIATSRRICPVSPLYLRYISRWVENVLEECDAPEEFYYDAAQQAGVGVGLGLGLG